MPMSTVVVRHDVVAAGLFDDAAAWQDFDLWLRLAVRRRHGAITTRCWLSGASARTGCRATIAQLERAINVSIASRRQPTAPINGAADPHDDAGSIASRSSRRLRFVEGNFAAAQYHLESSRDRSLKMQLARVALSVAPRLTRAIYLKLRRPATPPGRQPAPAPAI